MPVVACGVDADPMRAAGAIKAGAKEFIPLPPDAVHYVPDLEDVASVLADRARPGDLVLTLGAGSITRVGPEVLALLETRGADG